MGMVVQPRAAQSISRTASLASHTHSGEYANGAEGGMHTDVFHPVVDPNVASLQHPSAPAGAAHQQPSMSSIQPRHDRVVFPMADGVTSDWYASSGPPPLLSSEHSGAAPPFLDQVDAQTSTFDQDFFNQSLNWIPLSVFPSPYRPDMEEAFQYVFPPFSAQQDTPGPGLPSNASIIMSPPPHHPQRPFRRDHSGTASTSMTATLPTSTDRTPASATSEATSPKACRDGAGLRESNHRQSRRKSSKGSTGTPQFRQRPWQERRNTSSFAFPQVDDVTDAWRTPEHTLPLSAETYEVIKRHFVQLCAGDSSVFDPFDSDFFPAPKVVHACIQLYFEHFHHGFPLVHQPTSLARGLHQPH